jgi:hypothetical protein
MPIEDQKPPKAAAFWGGETLNRIPALLQPAEYLLQVIYSPL